MKNLFKRTAAFLAAIMFIVASSSTAFAVDDDENDIVAGTPKLAVTNGPVFEITAGETKEIEFNVRNLTASAANSILAIVSLDDAASTPLSISVKGSQNMGSLSGNANKTLTLVVTADENAEPKTYGAKINFSYRNANKVFSESSSSIYFKVENSSAEPSFKLDNFKTGADVIAAGESEALSFQLINNGQLNMNDVKISVEGDGTNLSIIGLNSRTFNQIHIGTRVDASFQVLAADGAVNGSYPITIKTTYKGDNGKDYEKEDKFYITIGTGSSTKSDVQIANMKEPKGTFGVNQNFTISFDLVNKGTAEAKNITISAAESGEGGNVVPKSTSVVSVDSLAAGSAKNISFDFAATSNAVSRNYAIEFTVTYEKNGKETTFKQYAGANVSNPEKDNEGEDEKKSKPKIIVSRYECDPVIVMAGEEFNLTMEFLNTHAVKAAKNVKMYLTLAEVTSAESTQTGNIFTPVDSSNTFYFDSIPPKGTVEKQMRLFTVPTAQPKTYTLTVNFEYEDEAGNEYTSTELLGINVKQAAKIETSEIVMPDSSETGMDVSLYFDIYNTGKVTLNNVKVELEGDIETQNKSMYLGNCASGESLSYEASFMPLNLGDNAVKIVISGEDPSGDIISIEKEYNIMGIEPMPVDDNINGEMPVEETGGNTLKTIGIIAAVVIIGGIAIFAVVKHRKKKAEMRLNAEDDDDEDSAEGQK